MVRKEYFLSNRNLKWYSIALSTIATNVQLISRHDICIRAQANLEIIIQGSSLHFRANLFGHKIFTITDFIEKKLGKKKLFFIQ